jgi:hypothetical protein
LCVTTTSPWTWIDRRVSGLQPATNRPIQTRFPYGSPIRLASLQTSKSLTHYTKGTQSPLRAPTACMHAVSGSISLPSPGFFSPFPHGTGSLSVGNEYLALEDGPPMFRQGFTCLALLNFTYLAFRIRGYHPLWPDFPFRSTKFHTLKGCSAFARHY